MDTKKIKELAEILNAYDLTRLKVHDEESKFAITLEKVNYGSTHPHPAITLASQTLDSTPVDNGQTVEMSSNDIKDIVSPMVGVFYTAPSEGSSPFVSVGSKVKKGDTLGIIESMKLMNDILSEYDGEITDICVSNNDVVEFGQALFRLRSYTHGFATSS